MPPSLVRLVMVAMNGRKLKPSRQSHRAKEDEFPLMRSVDLFKASSTSVPSFVASSCKQKLIQRHSALFRRYEADLRVHLRLPFCNLCAISPCRWLVEEADRRWHGYDTIHRSTPGCCWKSKTLRSSFVHHGLWKQCIAPSAAMPANPALAIA